MTTFINITSADNGTSKPSTGWELSAGGSISLVGGTTIDARVQKFYDNSGWQDIPDNQAIIASGFDLVFDTEGKYRIRVITATGTWTAQARNNT